MSVLCKLFGHKLQREPKACYTIYGPSILSLHADGTTSGGNILYWFYPCERCDKRTPVSKEDAAKKGANEENIARVMNGARAGYGLKPISWET